MHPAGIREDNVKKFAIAAATLAAAVAVGHPATAMDMEKTSMALPALTIGFTPTYIADAKGFWTKRGLEVKLHDIVGIGSMNAVLAGSVDFSNSSGPTVIRANIRGAKVQGVGSTLDGLPFQIIVPAALMKAAGVTASSPIAERAKVLKGKKISLTSPNTIPHVYLRYFLRKGGLNPERDVTVVSIPPEAGLAALKNNTTQGYVQGPPWTEIAQHQGLGIPLSSAITGDLPELNPVAYNIVVTRTGLCDEKPSVCKKLMAGYTEAMIFMHEHPAESIAILQKKMPKADPSVLKISFERIVKLTPKTTKINLAGLEHAQELMIVGGMIKESQKLASFDGIYTNKYAE